MKSTPALELFFRRERSTLIDVESQMAELFEFSRTAGEFSPLLQRWLLSSDKSEEDASRYEAFDANGPTSAALAVLREKSRGVNDIRSMSLWNGAEADAENATLSSRTNVMGRPDTVEFALRVTPSVIDWKTPVEWLQKAISIWHPSVAIFGPYWYSDHKVFEDRPGASWMLYLPLVLTAQQVPEAGALVPVMGKNNKGNEKQFGTIIVSVTDGQFSDENPEHIKIANAIETRLVDQDLLPRYTDL